MITDCDTLRTAEETGKEIERGHDERSFRGEGSPSTDPLRKDCLGRTRLPKASGWLGVQLFALGLKAALKSTSSTPCHVPTYP